jgi:NADH:ubiquinone reductase (H+-translocating)
MKIIILGGGFGGLKLADKLDGKKDFEVLLIDRFNYHQFQPLFYQVATAGLDASNISFPLRKAFHNSRNIKIRVADVVEVQKDKRTVVTSIGEFQYDLLVIAMGAETNFFGNEQMSGNAWPMKSTVEALRLRHHLIQTFEDALEEKDPEKRKALLTVVIVGGGPTGVELAGAIAEMKRWVLPKDYPELDFSLMNIFLVEGLPKVLAVMSEKSSQKSQLYLEELGVKVLTNTMVQDYDGEALTFKDEKKIMTRTVIWAAGIKGNVPFGIPSDSIVKGNRIKVDGYNKVIGMDDIYAIGDIAYMETADYPKGHPQVAPVAIEQARLLCDNLLALQKGKLPQSFVYHDKGSMATVGRHRAVADIPRPNLHLDGFLAWLAWMALHLMQILGVKNKIVTFINWVYSYFTYDQSLRLIFREFSNPSDLFKKDNPVKDKQAPVRSS